MITIAQLSADEVKQITPAQAIIFVATSEGERIGTVSLGSLENNTAYAFDLEVNPGFPEVAARLINRVRHEAKRQGYDRVLFSCEPNSPLMALIASGHARVECLWMSVKA